MLTNKKTLGFLLILFFSVLLNACLKPETFPIEPQIEFERVEQQDSLALFVITFTDGDGNIGMTDEDTLNPPFNTSDKFHNNLFLEYLEEDINGDWVSVQSPMGEPIAYQFRIPIITPDGKNKGLKGEIEVKLDAPYYNISSHDTVKFKYAIQLFDRDLNASNIVETTVLTK